MTYMELYEKALYLLEHNKINLGQYEEMIEPLNTEIREWIPYSGSDMRGEENGKNR